MLSGSLAGWIGSWPSPETTAGLPGTLAPAGLGSGPQAHRPSEPPPYTLALPNANHVFLPRHKIMAQVQSSWFPLDDRDPQTFVPNIFWAKPEDYRKATQRIYHAPGEASFIELPPITEP